VFGLPNLIKKQGNSERGERADAASSLGFPHFKRRKQGNLQAGLWLRA
jgi:hypothetical protein